MQADGRLQDGGAIDASMMMAIAAATGASRCGGSNRVVAQTVKLCCSHSHGLYNAFITASAVLQQQQQ